MDRSGLAHGTVLLGALIGILTPLPPGRTQENCAPIQFESGHSSATIRGTAPPEGVICYSFAAGAGQAAHLEVAGNNMIISVIGVGDARYSWTFKTKAQIYKFIVGQLMRSVTPERYTVTLSIK